MMVSMVKNRFMKHIKTLEKWTNFEKKG